MELQLIRIKTKALGSLGASGISVESFPFAWYGRRIIDSLRVVIVSAMHPSRNSRVSINPSSILVCDIRLLWMCLSPYVRHKSAEPDSRLPQRDSGTLTQMVFPRTQIIHFLGMLSVSLSSDDIEFTLTVFAFVA